MVGTELHWQLPLCLGLAFRRNPQHVKYLGVLQAFARLEGRPASRDA